MARRIVLGYGGVLVGVAITALGVSFFLIPAKIAAGGVSGLATVIYHPVSYTHLDVYKRQGWWPRGSWAFWG